MLARMKDGALALGLKRYLNEKFGDYGEILDVSVDTGANRLAIRAHLRGEAQPITATIDRYSLEREGDAVYVALLSFTTSREWLTRLLSRLLSGKRYKIPGAVAALL